VERWQQHRSVEGFIMQPRAARQQRLYTQVYQPKALCATAPSSPC